MIKLEILTSKHPDSLGEIVIHCNTLHLGNVNSDINLSDNEIFHNFFIIDILDNEKLMIQSQKREPYFQVNGKRCHLKKIIHANDIISFNSTSFKIIEFKYEEKVTYKEKLNQLTKQMNKNDPKFELIKKISETNETLY
jgi:hypothetical protein